VYQKLVSNEVADGLVEDMRVPVFRDVIPFVYLKYRSVDDRFVDRQHTNKKATIAEVAEMLSEQEIADICRFSQKLGLDYGELDVLRDSSDGRIYIVDANNTPSGPTSVITEDLGKKAVMRLANAFEQTCGV
jgi:D-alanine-D-alanine ligase-like ATP-grasp enzyme